MRRSPFPPAFVGIVAIKVVLFFVMGVMLAAAFAAERTMRESFAGERLDLTDGVAALRRSGAALRHYRRVWPRRPRPRPVVGGNLTGKLTMDTPRKLQLGEFTIAFLSDGIWRNDGGCMFGVVPRELWQREHPADDQNRIRLNLTCPLIMRGNDAIVVDTGIGNRLSRGRAQDFRPWRRLADRRAASARYGARRRHPRHPLASAFRSLRRHRHAARIWELSRRRSRERGFSSSVANSRSRGIRATNVCAPPIAILPIASNQ